jgi:hypothetical protein
LGGVDEDRYGGIVSLLKSATRFAPRTTEIRTPRGQQRRLRMKIRPMYAGQKHDCAATRDHQRSSFKIGRLRTKYAGQLDKTNGTKIHCGFTNFAEEP